jgi:hypothetical protein
LPQPSLYAGSILLAQLDDDSLCHGWAGFILSTWRAAADAALASPLPGLIPHLSGRLRETTARARVPGIDSGFLLGADGVQLTRQTIAAGGPPACPWDACLLLNG